MAYTAIFCKQRRTKSFFAESWLVVRSLEKRLIYEVKSLNFSKTLFNMVENYNKINSNQFEVMNCNDCLQQTRLKLFTFYVNLSDLLFVERNFYIGNHKNKVIIKSTANSMNTTLVSWVLHKIKKEARRDI